MNPRRVVLLLGTGRSGTTWLAAILDTYRKALYAHEPLTKQRTPEVDALVQRIKAGGGLSRDEHEFLARHWCRGGCECRRPPFFAKDFLRLPPSVEWVAWSLARVGGAADGLFRRIFSPDSGAEFDLVVKDIDWSRHAAGLVRALDAWFIHIVRHPCGVVASAARGQDLGLMPVKERSRWFEEHERPCDRFGFGRDAVLGMGPIEFLALEWLVQNSLYQEVVNGRPRSMAVVYEDLCRAPAATARRVFDFLGWEFGPQTMRFLETSTRPRKFGLLDRLQGKHPYFSVQKDPAQSAESWKRKLTTEQQEQVLSIARLLPGFEEMWPASAVQAQAPVAS